MDPSFYFSTLYPFQDQVLAIAGNSGTGFYLTGEAALGRVLLSHRFCNDLELNVNDDARFGSWTDGIIRNLSDQMGCEMQVFKRESRVTRVKLIQADINMDIFLVNDLPCRVGEPFLHPVYGKVDSLNNILSNKLRALLDHSSPNNLADVWGLCCLKGLSLEEALNGNEGKAAGIFPPDLARVLCQASIKDWESVQWMDAPKAETYLLQLHGLGEKLIFPDQFLP